MENQKTALVTGGTRGIGAAIAAILEQAGFSLIVTGTTQDAEHAYNLCYEGRRRYIQADFSDKNSLHSFIETVKTLNRLDVCVNNAGINIIKPVDDVSEEEFDRLTAINYKAPYFISQAAAYVMKKENGGRIVNIASIWSTHTKAGRSIYCASKAGLAGMTRAIATDLAKDNILVNCVSPGFTLTDLTRESLTDEELYKLEAQVPLGRCAKPAEIAKLVAFLCSEDNTYITGQNITIDGGFTNV
ncbi:MAG: SDR family oxidoreductase [Spartobacteria bacterium]|nr:SDR family oxidoreductase [Spartobacteria bacterium]